MNRTMLTLLGSILLAGCQSPASSARDATASPYGAAADVARVRHAQYSMWGEGPSMSRQRPSFRDLSPPTAAGSRWTGTGTRLNCLPLWQDSVG